MSIGDRNEMHTRARPDELVIKNFEYTFSILNRDRTRFETLIELSADYESKLNTHTWCLFVQPFDSPLSTDNQ